MVCPLSKFAMSLITQSGSSLSIRAAEGSAFVTRISMIASMGGSLAQIRDVIHTVCLTDFALKDVLTAANLASTSAPGC